MNRCAMLETRKNTVSAVFFRDYILGGKLAIKSRLIYAKLPALSTNSFGERAFFVWKK